MVTILVIRIFNISNSSISFLGAYPLLLIVFALAEMFAVFNYYSEKKIIALNEQFIQKKIVEKKLWGYTTMLSVVVPYVIGAILLNK